MKIGSRNMKRAGVSEKYVEVEWLTPNSCEKKQRKNLETHTNTLLMWIYNIVLCVLYCIKICYNLLLSIGINFTRSFELYLYSTYLWTIIYKRIGKWRPTTSYYLAKAVFLVVLLYFYHWKIYFKNSR